ncbi:hypothetical protein CBR_g11190 [Chara braunii]|uniref:Uncharacterized protein n=1 Tax=Chara braunii TaxID=69332 RepID=A0A388KQA9_CHABU|nr:hypothetical protein CBR_g11190 [Chara braunii]|eukprot:GBG72260.1 hypothetical protein CBR_g11190 [Chara braunii]
MDSGEDVRMSQDSGEDSGEDTEEEEWEDAEEEEELETLAQWIRTVHKLKWERHVECEVRLAHHKHLRNLKQATSVGDDITSTNRFEWLRKEQEVNEFYASQYAWKVHLNSNNISVHNGNYAKQFIWPKTYQPQRLKRSEQKRKAHQETEDKEGSGSQGAESPAQGTEEKEQIEEEMRQAAILEAQINVLKDQNRELEEDTINLLKIAYSPQGDINAAAKLFARHNPGRRVIIMYRWNSDNSDWEVAIHKTLALISTKDSHCSQDRLKDQISRDLLDMAQVVGSLSQDREEWQDTAGGKQTVDYRPILLRMQEKAKLTEGLIWMPWQVVEAIPYGLLGGTEAAEWVAKGAAILSKVDVFSGTPEGMDTMLAAVAADWEWPQEGS